MLMGLTESPIATKHRPKKQAMMFSEENWNITDYPSMQKLYSCTHESAIPVVSSVLRFPRKELKTNKLGKLLSMKEPKQVL